MTSSKMTSSKMTSSKMTSSKMTSSKMTSSKMTIMQNQNDRIIFSSLILNRFITTVKKEW
jgi:hypothetical protein